MGALQRLGGAVLQPRALDAISLAPRPVEADDQAQREATTALDVRTKQLVGWLFLGLVGFAGALWIDGITWPVLAFLLAGAILNALLKPRLFEHVVLTMLQDAGGRMPASALGNALERHAETEDGDSAEVLQALRTAVTNLEKRHRIQSRDGIVRIVIR